MLVFLYFLNAESHTPDTATVGGTLQLVPNQLVAKESVPQRTAQEISDMHGVSPAQQMDSVFRKIHEPPDMRQSTEVLFFHDRSREELVQRQEGDPQIKNELICNIHVTHIIMMKKHAEKSHTGIFSSNTNALYL